MGCVVIFPVDRTSPPATLVEQLLLFDWRGPSVARMGQIIRFPVERCRPPALDQERLCAEFDAEMQRLREYLEAAGPAWTESQRRRDQDGNGQA